MSTRGGKKQRKPQAPIKTISEYIETLKSLTKKDTQTDNTHTKGKILRRIRTILEGQSTERSALLTSEELDNLRTILSQNQEVALTQWITVNERYLTQAGSTARTVFSESSSSSAAAPAEEVKGDDEEGDEQEGDEQEGDEQEGEEKEQPEMNMVIQETKNEYTPSEPIKPSQVDILTPSEINESDKDLSEYLGKKPNRKTEQMIQKIGGFKSYMELKKKFNLNDGKKIMMSEFFNLHMAELKLSKNDMSDFTEKELLVLYNAYLINKFQVSTVDGMRVGAVIDLKSVIGRSITLKDLLNVAITPSTTQASQPSQPSQAVEQPLGDINVGAVKRQELSGQDLQEQQPITRQLQVGGVEQKLLNPDVSISALIKDFEGTHKEIQKVPKASDLAEDSQGNIVRYNINVISKKKKLHFHDRL